MDFIIDANGHLQKCKCYDETVVLPKNVKIISSKAFRGCQRVKKLIINSGVCEIEDNAFIHCKQLNEVVLPIGLKIIGKSAFQGLQKLESIIIPSGVEKIKENAFNECFSLSRISLPNTLKCIGAKAFAGCYNLKRIDLPNRLEYIGEDAFYQIGAKKIVLPSALQYLGAGAFSYSKIKEVNIPACLRDFTMATFEGNLTVKIIVSSDNPYFIVKGKLLLTKDEKKVVCAIDKYIEGKVIIPEGIEYIGDRAFENCSKITEIILPESIIGIGEGAFLNNNLINTLSFPNKIEKICPNAFFGCSKIKSINFPYSIKDIGQNAFSSKQIKKVTLPEHINIFSDKTMCAFPVDQKISFSNFTKEIWGKSAEVIMDKFKNKYLIEYEILMNNDNKIGIERFIEGYLFYDTFEVAKKVFFEKIKNTINASKEFPWGDGHFKCLPAYLEEIKTNAVNFEDFFQLAGAEREFLTIEKIIGDVVNGTVDSFPIIKLKSYRANFGVWTPAVWSSFNFNKSKMTFKYGIYEHSFLSFNVHSIKDCAKEYYISFYKKDAYGRLVDKFCIKLRKIID